MPLTLNLLSFSRPTATQIVTLVSTTVNGTQGLSDSINPALSADGRYVAFYSHAENLVAGDTNEEMDLFRKDLQTGEIVRLSTSSTGAELVDGILTSSYDVQLSTDGRYAIFSSFADMVEEVTSGDVDIFRKDLQTGLVTRVSVAANGTEGDGYSHEGQLSADGLYAVFTSRAKNLVEGDNNGSFDIFRKNLQTGVVTRISTAADGTEGTAGSQGAQLSADGRYVVFCSSAENLVDGDNNDRDDIFRKDLQTGAIIRVSTAADGAQSTGHSDGAQLSADGRYVVFTSQATDLVTGDTNDASDIFRKDLQTGAIVRVSTGVKGAQTREGSYDARISADGRYVVFTSDDYSLVAGDSNGSSDIYRKDLQTGEITRLSATADGAQASASDGSYGARFSADGRYVVFQSYDNLVAGDTNNKSDVYRLDTLLKDNAAAVAEQRFVELKLGVGSASSVSIAWGDGSTSTSAPAGGTAAFHHAYATTGLKAASVTVKEGAQTWIVPHRIDLASGQMSRDTTLADTLTGDLGADALTGDAFANILKGVAGNDILKSDAGDDKLYGGLGKDTLYGGTGRDIFVFDTRANSKTNLDRVVDFKVKDDTIWLDNKYFTKLGKGTPEKPQKLAKKAFFVGTKAHDADDRIIYDNKKGVVFYDSDGTGKAAAVQIATIGTKHKLTIADVFVI